MKTVKDYKFLGPPRIFIEVIREFGETGQYVRSRKEIDLRVWRDVRHNSAIIENEINSCLREVESYGGG